MYQFLQAHPAVQHNRLFWLPHLHRDQLNALAGLSRFAISEAEGLAAQALAICEKRGEPQDALLAFLIHRSLARAYIQHHNFKAAYRILAENMRN